MALNYRIDFKGFMYIKQIYKNPVNSNFVEQLLFSTYIDLLSYLCSVHMKLNVCND